jgi:hypothetical protein
MLVQVTHCVEVGLRPSQLKRARIICRIGLISRSGIFKRRFHNAHGRAVMGLAFSQISYEPARHTPGKHLWFLHTSS